MDTYTQPLPNEIKHPLRNADWNGSTGGDTKLYIIGSEPIGEEKRWPTSYKIFTLITLSLTLAIIVVLGWYFTNFDSSTWEDTLETIDANTVLSGISRDEYEGNQTDTLHDRVQNNVLLIISDDAGWADFGAYNRDRFSSLVTPVLDNFMEQGHIFKNFHTQPICTPARGSLFTGRWTWALGMQGSSVLSECTNGHLPENIPTWAELLAERGYINHFIGKWNLGSDSWFATPLGRGFDTFIGALNHPKGLNRGGGGEWSLISGKCEDDPMMVEITDVFEKCLATCFSYTYATWSSETMQCGCYLEGTCSTQTMSDVSEESIVPSEAVTEEVSSTIQTQNQDGHGTYTLYEWRSQHSKSIDWFDNTDGADPQVGLEADDIMVNRALNYMEQLTEQDSPWTMTIAFTTPHASNSYLPNGTMNPISDGCYKFFNEGLDTYNYNRGIICQKMSDLDSRVDSLLSKLKNLDLFQETLVVIVNDNGADPGQSDYSTNPNYGLNWPYRGGKFTFWEGGIRTVLALGGGALPAQYWQQENYELHDIVDVAATILAAGGFSNQDLEANNIDGVPLININSAKQKKHETIYHNMPMSQSDTVSYNSSVITWNGMKFVGKNSYLSQILGDWSTLPESNSIGKEFSDISKCSDDGCLYDLNSDPFERKDLSSENSAVVAKITSLISEVIEDPSFNHGIIYSTEKDLCGIDESYTHIDFGDRTYFYNYPWLDTSEELYDRRRLREKRRDDFRQRKKVMRRKSNLNKH